MELPVDSWYAAISQRHSQRTFNGERVSDDSLEILEKLSDAFRPFRSVRSIIVRNPPKGVFKGLIGSYGEVKNAPHLGAFIGDITVPEVQEAVGYLGEGIILQATSMGLSTCWIGGFFRPEVLEDSMRLGKNEKVLAITPIGYGTSRKSLRDRLMSLAMRSHRRKPIKKLLIKDNNIQTPWIQHALEAARLAPSAANRQPWRFHVEPDSITVKTGNGLNMKAVSKRLDCGIAMLHVELGARAHGGIGTWEFLEDPDVARYSIS